MKKKVIKYYKKNIKNFNSPQSNLDCTSTHMKLLILITIGHYKLKKNLKIKCKISKIIVQIKSFEGNHYDLSAVDQVKTGIEKYDGTAGMIITTAQRTEALENKIQNISKVLDCHIDLLAGDEVAKFIIKNASDLLFRL